MPITTLDKIKARVGFIGLGLMGSRLARRLHTYGWNIRGMEPQSTASRGANEGGIAIAPSIADLVTGSDVVLSSLGQ